MSDLGGSAQELGNDVRQAAAGLRAQLRTIWVITAVLGIVFGILLLINPLGTSLSVAIFAGIAMVIGGIARIVYAIASKGQSTGLRWLWALLGVLIALGGVLCLISPVGFIAAASIFIGVGWLFSGVADIIAGITGVTSYSRTWSIIGGIISVIAGIMLLAQPLYGAIGLATAAGLLLIIFSIASLAALPKKTA